MQPLDWPLRSIAGKWSSTLLQLFGKTTELDILRGEENIPLLILFVNEHPFHVASECNGFGVILTSILIGYMLAIYKKLSSLDTTLNLLAGATFGFAFNILRIVIIVLLAPNMMDHYMLMHEIVGTITYWGCLISLWLFLKGPTQYNNIQRPQPTSQ